MTINLSVLDAAVAQSIRPCLIDQGHLQTLKSEGYHHQQVLPKVKPLLTREALEADSKGNLERAVKSSTNMLSQFDVTPAVAFFKSSSADEVTAHAVELLYGDELLLERIQAFHEWSKMRGTTYDKKAGVTLVAVSFLLAMSNPSRYAFCKPNVYSAAVRALLGTKDEGNVPLRLVHATEFYAEALTLFQQRYSLPFTDLHHVHIAFYSMANPYDGFPGWDDLESTTSDSPPLSLTPSAMHDLNVILYGPPGTGKTYDTIRRAVAICDGNVPDSRSEMTARFNELLKESRVSFVTFHQAYGYEDFIEGLRPVLAEDSSSPDSGSDIRYECRPGIFKQLCELAKTDLVGRTGGVEIDWNNTTVWKMSLGDTNLSDDAMIFEESINENVIRLGYGDDHDFSDCDSKEAIFRKFQSTNPDVKSTDYPPRSVETLCLRMKEGDLVVISDGNSKFRAIARIKGPYQLLDKEIYRQARPVDWIVRFAESLPYELIYNKKFSQTTLYRLKSEELRREALAQLVSPPSAEPRNYVLIIDEINRGNVSKILGELITLLEPDKRLDADNELQVTLPYSGKPFGVPRNVHIIGTMNTADRSIAFLDVALRRRFTFVEMMPEYLLLRERWKQNSGESTIDVAKLLEVINDRIEFLYDRDHQIGHSFFLNVTSVLELRDVFISKVIPLLQEYFYSDWSKVCLVLGCPVNSDSSKLQANPNPLIVARSLKAASLLSDADEYDDKISYAINREFAEAMTTDQIKVFFTSILS